MTSVSSVCNRGLQELGAARILNITDDSRNGRACNAAYDPTRKAELRRHYWRFAIKRVVLSPEVTAPAFDYKYQFQLPSDCLKIIKPQDIYLDWQLEGGKILTNLGNSINLRYIADITDPNMFDPLFAEMLSMRIGMNICEEVTQSNTKQATLMEKYKELRDEAKKANAFETVAATSQPDPYLVVRETTTVDDWSSYA